MRRWLFVGLLLLVPLSLAWVKRPDSPEVREATARKSPDVERGLLGLWSRFSPVKPGDRQRFYYFHTGGIGLFRYGRLGLTYTQTFRYDVDSKVIRLTFNRASARHPVQHQVKYRLEGRALTLLNDPKMGGEQTYTHRPLPTTSGDGQAFDHPLARLWVEAVPNGHGMPGFRMYQLQAPTIDGRGVGWYHEGDHTEWSTEALSYRRTGDRIVFTFPVRLEEHVSTIVEGQADGVRTLHLTEDPRNFWHPRTYRDGGPGFTMRIADDPMPYHVPGHGAAAHHGSPHGHQ